MLDFGENVVLLATDFQRLRRIVLNAIRSKDEITSGIEDREIRACRVLAELVDICEGRIERTKRARNFSSEDSGFPK